MLSALKSLFSKSPKPAGPPRLLRSYAPPDVLIASDGVSVEENGWRIDLTEGTLRLFELSDPGVESCLLTYRAQLKTADLRGSAYLEMWCRLPGRGEFFSKGLHNKIMGTTGWASYEVPFFLKAGERPDMLKLNIVSEGTGVLWIKDIEVLSTPMA